MVTEISFHPGDLIQIHCLKAPGGNASKDIHRGCKNVIMNQYGSTKPTFNQMRADYNDCP